MKQWITLVLLLISHLNAEIIETAHFSDIVPHITQDTLVILDIDDTLLIPVQMLGCDEWFTERLKSYEAAGLSSAEALEKSLNEWQAVRFLTKMEIVEKGSEKIVSSVQDKGFSVMGLTTQGLALATCTPQQLQHLGVDLARTAPSHDDIAFPMKGLTVLFRKGILFTAGTSKGESLFTLCEKIGYTPKRIVFLNDKATHLRDIESSAEKRGIEFVGLRYAYSDSRKKAYSPKIAAYQFTNSRLPHLLSDEEARVAIGG